MTEIASLYFCENRPEDALAQVRRVLALNPGFPTAQSNLVRYLVSLGRVDEATAAIEQISAGGPKRLLRALVLAKRGDRIGAMKLLDDAMGSRLSIPVSPFAAARAYAALGDRERTIEWLTRAYEQHDAYFVWALCAAPDFQDLRADPRFVALKKKIGK
jgi:tetratricopeptide (TPR) repeat protein